MKTVIAGREGWEKMKCKYAHVFTLYNQNEKYVI